MTFTGTELGRLAVEIDFAGNTLRSTVGLEVSANVRVIALPVDRAAGGCSLGYAPSDYRENALGDYHLSGSRASVVHTGDLFLEDGAIMFVANTAVSSEGLVLSGFRATRPSRMRPEETYRICGCTVSFISGFAIEDPGPIMSIERPMVADTGIDEGGEKPGDDGEAEPPIMDGTTVKPDAELATMHGTTVEPDAGPMDEPADDAESSEPPTRETSTGSDAGVEPGPDTRSDGGGVFESASPVAAGHGCSVGTDSPAFGTLALGLVLASLYCGRRRR